MQGGRRATLRKEFLGVRGHTIFPGYGSDGLSMLVKMSSVVILHQCCVAMVEIDDTVSDQIFLVMKVDFLGRDTYK